MEGMTTAELLDAALEGKLDEDAAYTDTPNDDTPNDDTPNDDTTSATASDDGDTSTEQPNQPQAGATDETEVEGAPIRSKSGEYTIPYEKLVEARNERNALRERVAQLEQQIAGLSTQQQQNLAAAQADAQDRASAGQGQTEADANLAAATQAMADGVDVSIFGDFSEEDLAKGIAELNRRATERVRAELQETIRQELAPLHEKEAKRASQAHYDAILEKHADAFEIAESAEFAAWRDGLPAFAKAGVEHALTKGSAQEVIEVFDAFRATSKPQPHPQPTNPAPQPAAPEAIKPRVPNSLSEVPGAAPIDSTQQVLAAAGNTGALLDRMSSMTPEQLDALMDHI